jgi:hypothetical protein
MAVESDRRADGLARNQAFFREVNERVQQIAVEFGDDACAVDFLCECADERCTASLSLTLEEYERLRDNPRHFAVVADSGHVVPDVEHVVERYDSYWVVKKLGAAGAVATELDAASTRDGSSRRP